MIEIIRDAKRMFPHSNFCEQKYGVGCTCTYKETTSVIHSVIMRSLHDLLKVIGKWNEFDENLYEPGNTFQAAQRIYSRHLRDFLYDLEKSIDAPSPL
jgi:hypothetical protein